MSIMKTCTRDLLRFLISPCRVSLIWIPLLLCLGGLLIDLTIFFPGQTSLAEVIQYTQSVNGRYSDWHPPIMPATMRLLRNVCRTLTGIEGTGQKPLYVIQSVLLWSGLFVILQTRKQFWRNQSETFPKAWWMILAAGVLAAMFWIEAVTWSRLLRKDNVMVGCYLLATGLLFNMPSAFWKKCLLGLLTLFLLFYGTALRYNAIFALLPMLFWLVWHFLPSRFKKMLPILVGGFLLWGSFLYLNQFVNYHVLHSYRLYPIHECLYGDIFRLNALGNSALYQNPPNSFGNSFDNLTKETFLRDYEPEYIFQNFAFKHFDQTTYPYHFMQESTEVVPESEFFCKDSEREPSVFYEHTLARLDPEYKRVRLRKLNENFVKEQYPKDYLVLRNAWLKRIKADPISYFKIKMKLWLRFLTLSSFRTIYLGTGGFFNGLMMLTISLLLCLFTFSPKRLHGNMMSFLMPAWSAVFIAVPLLFFLPSDDVRYVHWFMTSAFIALFTFCAQSKLFWEILQTIQCRLTMIDKEY